MSSFRSNDVMMLSSMLRWTTRCTVVVFLFVLSSSCCCFHSVHSWTPRSTRITTSIRTGEKRILPPQQQQQQQYSFYKYQSQQVIRNQPCVSTSQHTTTATMRMLLNNDNDNNNHSGVLFGQSNPGGGDKTAATSRSKSTDMDASTNDSFLNLIDDPSAAALYDKISEITEPVQGLLDGVTDGWALSYADLSPESTSTWIGQSFLATNLAYLAAGIFVTFSGDVWFGFWTDVCAVASFNYHYNQLLASGKQTYSSTVRLALLLDYTAAAVSILTATVYLFGMPTLPITALAASVAGLIFLYMSWIWEYGRPYIVWHSLWHLCSGYAGYLIGTMHATTTTTTQTIM